MSTSASAQMSPYQLEDVLARATQSTVVRIMGSRVHWNEYNPLKVLHDRIMEGWYGVTGEVSPLARNEAFRQTEVQFV